MEAEMMVLFQRRPAADWEIICGNCSAAVSAVTSPKTGRAISKQPAHGLERALNSLGDQIQFEKKSTITHLRGKRYFPFTDEVQNSKSSCIWKNTVQLIDSRGTDRRFAHFPVKTGNAFDGDKVSAACLCTLVCFVKR